MVDVTSRVIFQGVDNLSPTASHVEAALKAAADRMKQTEAELSRSTVGDKLKGQLRNLGATATQVGAVTRAWEQYAKAEGLAASRKDWTKEQVRNVRVWENVQKSAIRNVMADERKLEAQHRKLVESTGRGGGGHGSETLVGLAGLYAAHSFGHGVHQVLENYGKFDSERRYSRVVMGLNDQEQEPLVKQALHGGASTRFSDIEWLAAQRELAARGYGKDQVLGFTPTVAQLGTAFDRQMPEAVKLLEGAMLSLGKDTSTYAKAMAAAQRTADLEVKASKVSGMTADDIEALYKYGAPGAKMAGLSEESLLAFGGLLKKSNMGGDEAGTAFRALSTRLVSPTAEGRTAMAAAGIDYGKFQKAPSSLDTEAFAGQVAQRYGVTLSKNVKDGIDKIFHNSDLLNDATAFVPAVTHFLQGVLGGKDAKSLKSIAGLARDFRQSAAGGVDTMGLMAAMMEAMSKNKNLANAIFGSKQGGRIFAALGDPAVYKQILDQITNHSQGFAANVAEARTEGFSGAVKVLEGSIETLKSSLGRAWDDNGRGGGGALTKMTEMAADVTRGFAELPASAQRAATELTAVAAAGAALKTFDFVRDGFGLKSLAQTLEAQTVKSATLTATEVKLAGAAVSVGTLAIGAVTAVALVDYLSSQGRKKVAADDQHFGEAPAMKLPDQAKPGAPPAPVTSDTFGRGRPPPSIDENTLPGHFVYGRGGFRQRVLDAPPGPVPQMRNPPTFAGMVEPQTGDLSIGKGMSWQRFADTPRMPASGFGADAGIKATADSARDAKAALDQLNKTKASPQVDSSGLDELIDKANAAAAAIRGIGRVSSAGGGRSSGPISARYSNHHPVSAGMIDV